MTLTYLAGLDLGQAHDSTALVIAKTTDEAEVRDYDIVAIERMELGTRYPDIVQNACDAMEALSQPTPESGHRRPSVHLVVDFTGVGRPVADMLLRAQPKAQVQLVTITGGDTATYDQEEGCHRVPKRDLAATVQVLLQAKRLRIASSLPMASELARELTGFRVKINLATGHDSYGAAQDWRIAQHDDLVLALAMATWFGEQRMMYGRLFY